MVWILLGEAFMKMFVCSLERGYEIVCISSWRRGYEREEYKSLQGDRTH